MRKLVLYFFLIVNLLSSCKRTQTKDPLEINSLLSVIDSMLSEVNIKQDQMLTNLYILTDDSLKVDSLSKVIDLPDTLGFYQYLEIDIQNLNEFVIQTKKEINFTRDQLLSVKTDYLENKITDIEFEKEITEIHQMIDFLKERVDTNMMLINRRYNPLFNNLNDTLQYEEPQ